ncbi:MAG: PAS domain S-box protein [Alphaproteobacteria bacterium]|uniref:PAS domain S-box protein n=1 Tax=Candidatus Nitrobium versatile TaxID=2884831 RepID=A0A953J6I8_9BACT|nr:PAS domain S-box protein [Candidatus Nitrobium versatile]
MREKEKTKKELQQEAEQLRRRVAELEAEQREFKKLKREFIDTKSFYEGILNGITCGVWVSDRHDRIKYANRGMEMIAGTTKQKLVGYRALTSSSEAMMEQFQSYYEEAKETLQPVYYSEVPVLTPAGRQTYQSGWLIPRVREKKYDGMICILEDITNQREIRKALSESEAKYHDLVENVNSIIMQMDLKGTITFFNRFAQEFFGFREDEIIGRNVMGTIIPRTERHIRSIKRLLEGISRNSKRYTNREQENIRKSGERSWIAWTHKALLDSEGRISEILCVGTDITERKHHEELLKRCRSSLEREVRIRTAQLTKANEELQHEILERKWAEKVLKSSEEKYRLVVENANEGIAVTQDNFFKYLNPKAVRIFGHPEEVLTSRLFFEFFHPDDRDIVVEKHLRRLKGDMLPHLYSARIIDKDGNMKWLEINSVLITWMGRPATLAFFSNITERRKTEEMLKLLESAIQQTTDSIIITTARPEQFTSKVVFVNKAFTTMTGYTPEDVVGRLSIILQGPKTDSTEWFKLESSQARGKAFYVEAVNYRKDGTRFYHEWQISPIRDERGKVTHFISTQRDITKRKKGEEELNAYQEKLRALASELTLTEERERRRIATNLHDHIGQTLAITKIKLGELRNALSSTSLAWMVDSIRVLIEKTIQYTKTLTFELSPPILHELGFKAAMEWLCERMQKEHGISFAFREDGRTRSLDNDISILLFQAVRELLINVVKHAKAKSVQVSLLRDESSVRIIVEDDGVGFDASKMEKASFGFFSIRERVKHLGGTFIIDSKPGQGTKVTLTSPVTLTQN